MAKSEKPATAAPEGEAPKPKSKKKLLIFAGAAVLLLGLLGGGGWYYFAKIRPAKATAEKKDEVKAPVVDPVFLVLEPLTVNLQHDEGEQFLQIGITLKIVNQETSDKIRGHMPEVRSRIIFLLSSKHASELLTVEGKKKLADEIKAETSPHSARPRRPAPLPRWKPPPRRPQHLREARPDPASWMCCLPRSSFNNDHEQGFSLTGRSRLAAQGRDGRG
jgi:flagellar FliL protein